MKRFLVVGCSTLALASIGGAGSIVSAQVPSQSDIEQSAGLAARFVYAATTGQTYVVKAPGIYDLEVAGARGGRGPNPAPLMGGTVRTAMHGATVRGELQLNAGAVLHIFVGADGGSTGAAPTGKGGGGGGGTFVVDDTGQPIAVAGGGGGTSNQGVPPDFNGSTYTKLPEHPDGYTGAHGAGISHDSGGSGGGGAGFYANGDDGATSFTFGFGKALGGSSYANGFAGGRGAGGLDGGGGNGGYGGGGGGGDGFRTGGGGGGGGYAGGGGGASSNSGDGGFSYIAGLLGGTVVDAGDHAAYVTIKLHL